MNDYTIDQIVEMAQSKMGIPIIHQEKPDESIIIPQREAIRNIQDNRLERHDKKTNQLFSDKLDNPFYQLHSISKSPIQIKDETFQDTFLNHSKRYSEALFYSERAAGPIRALRSRARRAIREAIPGESEAHPQERPRPTEIHTRSGNLGFRGPQRNGPRMGQEKTREGEIGPRSTRDSDVARQVKARVFVSYRRRTTPQRSQ